MKLFGLLAASAAAFTHPLRDSAGQNKKLCEISKIVAMADFTNGFQTDGQNVEGQIFFTQNSCNDKVTITGNISISGKSRKD